MNIYKTFQNGNYYKTSVIASVIICMLISSLAITGCETRAQTGSLAGAGIGALLGQAIGGDTKATLIGTAIGAGAGYLIGNSQDKKQSAFHDYFQPTALTGTKWKVIDLVKQDKPKFESMTVEFRPDGKIVTTRHESDGTMIFGEEKYRIVGSTLIINKSDYIVNADYKVIGNDVFVN